MKTFDEFLEFVKKRTWFYFAYDGYDLVGAIWFTDFRRTSCNIHYCSIYGYEMSRFKQSISKLLQTILENSPLTCYKILGKTPYRAAIRYFSCFGFKSSGSQLELDASGKEMILYECELQKEWLCIF